jgi:transcriptional regulator with XRE-family HTH domain
MKVSVRTIQRIESGESIPRKYTLKTVAEALGLSFEELSLNSDDIDIEETRHFLNLLCVPSAVRRLRLRIRYAGSL